MMNYSGIAKTRTHELLEWIAWFLKTCNIEITWSLKCLQEVRSSIFWKCGVLEIVIKSRMELWNWRISECHYFRNHWMNSGTVWTPEVRNHGISVYNSLHERVIDFGNSISEFWSFGAPGFLMSIPDSRDFGIRKFQKSQTGYRNSTIFLRFS